MARYEFKLPDIGEGVADGEVLSWHIQPGDLVAEDQPMVEVMTDKATVVIGAPRAGRVAELRAAVGQTVKVGAVLVVFDPASEPAAVVAGLVQDEPRPNGVATAAGADKAASACGDIREELPGLGLAHSTRGAAPPIAARAEQGYYREKPLATPATRKLARDLGIDLRTIAPTGPGGRTTSADVRAAEPVGATARTALAGGQPAARPATQAASRLAGVTERTPVRGVRRRMFDVMTHAHQTVANCTFVEECDATALKALRARLQPRAERRGAKLSYLPFIARSVVLSLRQFPELNAVFDERQQDLLIAHECNLGIATATESGLIVPVVHAADKLTLLELSAEIQRVADAARTQTLTAADLQGGTFTITSLGTLGGFLATPIVHSPEVAILGVHRMKERPVVRDGQIVVGDVMNLSLSFDHRLVDGRTGAAFTYAVIEYLENPDLLLLE